MKLIFCECCQDVVKCQYERRTCVCGASWGRYLENGVDAEIGGRAVPLGFDNRSLATALVNRPRSGAWGSRFEAFVIPRQVPTVKEQR